MTGHSRPASTVEPAAEGLTVTLQDIRYTVGPACGARGGYRVCVTHSEILANQLGKDSHIRQGQHLLAWMCAEHGLEVP